VPLQGLAAAQARAVLPPELHAQRQGRHPLHPEGGRAIRAALANYARLTRLVDRWIDLATELSDLEIAQRPSGRKASKRA
jgi:hypothetical protein